MIAERKQYLVESVCPKGFVMYQAVHTAESKSRALDYAHMRMPPKHRGQFYEFSVTEYRQR